MNVKDLNIKDIVGRGQIVNFHHYRQNYFYYTVEVVDDKNVNILTYQFPVPLNEIGEASLLNQDKALFFMRYIKKAISNGTFLKA